MENKTNPPPTTKDITNLPIPGDRLIRIWFKGNWVTEAGGGGTDMNTKPITRMLLEAEVIGSGLVAQNEGSG